MGMTQAERDKCSYIIHSNAAAAAAGNAIQVPGAGFATDTITMATMAMELCAVFGGSIPMRVAESLAIAAIKKEVLKQPIKVLAKEASKLVPGLGQVVAPAVSVAMLESAGWILADELSSKRKGQPERKQLPGRKSSDGRNLPSVRNGPGGQKSHPSGKWQPGQKKHSSGNGQAGGQNRPSGNRSDWRSGNSGDSGRTGNKNHSSWKKGDWHNSNSSGSGQAGGKKHPSGNRSDWHSGSTSGKGASGRKGQSSWRNN